MAYQDDLKRIRGQLQMSSLEDRVPADHPIRKIDFYLDWDHIREMIGFVEKKAGRKATDPIVLVKIIMLRYLFNFKSLRVTLERLKTDNSMRWFVGLTDNDPMPSKSVVYQFYKDTSKEHFWDEIFDYINSIIASYGFIQDDQIYVDSTDVKAYANPHKHSIAYVKEETGKNQQRMRQELEEEINQKREANGVKKLKVPKQKEAIMSDDLNECLKEVKKNCKKMKEHNIKDFEPYYKRLKEGKKKDPVIEEALNWMSLKKLNDGSQIIINEPTIQIGAQLVKLSSIENNLNLTEFELKKVSTNDPQSGIFHKDDHKSIYAYLAQACSDPSGFILSANIFAGNASDAVCFLDFLDDIDLDVAEKLGVDKGYDSPLAFRELMKNNVEIFIPKKKDTQNPHGFDKSKFTYREESDDYICPKGRILTYSHTTREGYDIYKSCGDLCSRCPLLEDCTSAKDHVRSITDHIYKTERQWSQQIQQREDFNEVYAKRKTSVERAFANSKQNTQLANPTHTGKEEVKSHVELSFMAHNLKTFINTLDKFNMGKTAI